MSHRDVVLRAIDAIRRADAAAYAELFADDAVLSSPLAPIPLSGRRAIQEAEQALFDAFSHIEVEVVTLLATDESAAAEVIVRAVNTGHLDLGEGLQVPATGRQIELRSVWLFDFGPSGLIAAERDYFDTARFMAQIGISA